MTAGFVAGWIFFAYVYAFPNGFIPPHEHLPGNEYDLIEPSVAALNAENYLDHKNTARIFYQSLRQEVVQEIESFNKGKASFYFEDLHTGSWVGIDERVGFVPASLVKIPTLAAVLDVVSRSEDQTLETILSITPSDIDTRSGSLDESAAGQSMTIGELATRFVHDSDNTSGNVLKHLISIDDLMEARAGMGIPPLDTEGAVITPKIYSNVFRALYQSTFLSRPLSQYMLTLLENTPYTNGLRAGVPSEVRMSHKVGAFQSLGSYHDCGIVYYPGQHYFICVMTSGMDSYDEANKLISRISQVVYENVKGNTAPME